MLVSLLLLFILHSQVSCEWVEISQQYYLKPARTTRVYPKAAVIKDVERTTKANRVYVNNSLSNPNWSKGAVYKVPNTEIKRLINSEPLKSKPINFEEDKIKVDGQKIFVEPNKQTSEENKKPPKENSRFTEHVYYNKDNVKRITFTSTEESLKPLEVLNLSDLGYDEKEFPTIEVDDETFRVEQLEQTKHLTAVIPTEDEEDHSSHNLPNTVQSHSKNYETKSLSTEAPTKKDIKPRRKTPTDHNLSKSSEKEGDGLSKSISDSDTMNSNNVATLNQKSSITSHSIEPEKIKQENPRYRNNNSSNSQLISQGPKLEKNSDTSKMINTNKSNLIQKLDSSSETASYKVMQEKPKLEKNVLRINELPKRSKIRNPEEVMLEEILHESDESFEAFNHKTLDIGTVTNVYNKSMITKVKPEINESERKYFKPVKSQIQRTKNKHKGTVGTKETDKHDQKNIIIEDTTATANSKIEESKEFEDVHLNTPRPVLVKTENLFESDEPNYHKKSAIATTTENIYREEQDKQKVFVLTATSNQEETKIKVQPPVTETTATVNVEFTTTTSPVKLTTMSDEKLESTRLDSIKPVKNEDQEQDTDETLANDTTADTLGTLVKVLKLVTETISRNSRKTIKGKMRYLEELRDTIMASIEQRLEAVFPDDEGAGAATRRARSARAQGRGHGHVEFPSSESALMSISFLTFAVFLIKLVLQVIQAYKQKTMMMPAVVATVGRAYHHYSKTKAGELK